MDSYNRLVLVIQRIAELETLRSLKSNGSFLHALETEELEKLRSQRDTLLHEVDSYSLTKN